MNRKYCVYIHTAPNNKKYVGQTMQAPETRWVDGKGYADNPYFTNVINKYGWDNIKHEIIRQGLTAQQADILEQELIKKHRTTEADFGYNLQHGGHGGQLHTQATKNKISTIMKKTYNGTFSPEHREAISASKRGKCSEAVRQVCLQNSKQLAESGMSEETKRKISEAKKNKPGRVWTEEDKEKHSVRMKQVYSSKG